MSRARLVLTSHAPLAFIMEVAFVKRVIVLVRPALAVQLMSAYHACILSISQIPLKWALVRSSQLQMLSTTYSWRIMRALLPRSWMALSPILLEI